MLKVKPASVALWNVVEGEAVTQDLMTRPARYTLQECVEVWA